MRAERTGIAEEIANAVAATRAMVPPGAVDGNPGDRQADHCARHAEQRTDDQRPAERRHDALRRADGQHHQRGHQQQPDDAHGGDDGDRRERGEAEVQRATGNPATTAACSSNTTANMARQRDEHGDDDHRREDGERDGVAAVTLSTEPKR